MDKFNLHLLILIIAVLLIGLAGGYLIAEKLSLPADVLSTEDVSKKVVDFIKQMEGFSEESVIEVLEITDTDNDLYRLKLSIDGQVFVSYVTKDGHLLFPEFIDMNPPENQKIPLSEKPVVDLFVMSFCPYGNQAEDLMKPVVNLLDPVADFNLHYIIYSNYQSEDFCLSPERKYCSMHKTAEVNQDIRELCVAKYQPDKLWNFVDEINKSTTVEKVEEEWEAIATNIGLDIDKIKQCQAEEGTALLDREIELTGQEYLVQNPSRHQENGEYKTKESIQGSPTLVINGMIYDGEKSTKGYQEAICAAFENVPSACAQEVESNGDSGGEPAGVCE